MKKKMLVAITMIIVLSFTVGMLTGCDEIFKKNDDRDAHLIVASVNYQGMTSDIKKFEFEDQFNAYAYMYVNYYGMSYEAAADYIVRSLAQRELLVLYAKEFLEREYWRGVLGNEQTEPGLLTLKQLLTTSEYDKAVRNTNDDMLSALETVVKNSITEDKENKPGDNTEPEDEEVEVTTPVTVKFDSDGGSAVEKQKIQKGTKAKEPAAPTKSGYTFYGWYLGDPYAEGATEFDFKETPIDSNITLKAKWVEYLTPRPERPDKPEEDEDKDYDPDNNEEMKITPFFFTDEYIATINFSEKDFVKDIPEGGKTLEKYISNGIAEIKKNLTDSYKSYEYYLESQMKTLLIAKLERYIGNGVGDVDVAAQFDRIVAENKELFSGTNGEKSFENALTSSLASTYYFKETGYGFVNNILLKLDDDSVKQLIKHSNDGWTKEQLLIERDARVKSMTVRVSNPDYDTEFEMDYGAGVEADDIRDPMTDPKNPYNVAGTKYNKDNDYNNMVSFRYNVDEKRFEIVNNVHEAPSMAYLINGWNVFDQGTEGTADFKRGIVTQIYESFEKIKDAVTTGVEGVDKDGNTDGTYHKISPLESVYWLREMATNWLYLVGDDSGALNTDSNNGGLGYLINPEGKKSGYLPEFTDQARALINKGIGSFTIADDNASKADKIKGSYVVADSFINSDTKVTSFSEQTYVGVFVIFCSYSTSVGYTKDADGNISSHSVSGKNILPKDWVLTYGETDEDCVTVFEQLEKQLKDGKKADRYSEIVNKFGVDNYNNITYNKDNYKSVWKNASKS